MYIGSVCACFCIYVTVCETANQSYMQCTKIKLFLGIIIWMPFSSILAVKCKHVPVKNGIQLYLVSTSIQIFKTSIKNKENHIFIYFTTNMNIMQCYM